MQEIKPRKSERMSKIEIAKFRKWVSTKVTRLDAMDELNITRPTLDRVLALGQGSPDTINKIREALNQTA
jgi:hypothetical protein